MLSMYTKYAQCGAEYTIPYKEAIDLANKLYKLDKKLFINRVWGRYSRIQLYNNGLNYTKLENLH